MAKYVVVRQMKRSPFTVIDGEEFEVRNDARVHARESNRMARVYKFKVVLLKPGKIKRKAP